MAEDIFKNKPHFNLLAMCLACSHRWIATVMAQTSLFKLECSKCKAQDSFASFLPLDYMSEFEEFESNDGRGITKGEPVELIKSLDGVAARNKDGV